MVVKEKIFVRNTGKQMSDSFFNCIFLAMSGGFQDAYTYFTRDKVFSNAQTGNVVLMSEHFMQKEWNLGVKHLLPILAFAFGVFVTEQIQVKFRFSKHLHWRQLILLCEIIILFGVGFIPYEWNDLATILVSFTCAMQVQAFRKVDGYAYASTMCIGNLRGGTESLSAYTRTHNKKYLRKALYYYGIIAFFALGAGFGGVFCPKYGIHSIWISIVLLLISTGIMCIDTEKSNETK